MPLRVATLDLSFPGNKEFQVYKGAKKVCSAVNLRNDL